MERTGPAHFVHSKASGGILWIRCQARESSIVLPASPLIPIPSAWRAVSPFGYWYRRQLVPVELYPASPSLPTTR